VIAKVEQNRYLDDVVRQWLRKSYAHGAITGDVFECIQTTPVSFVRPRPHAPADPTGPSAQLGGPWSFYRDFCREHELDSLGSLRPEIAVRPNATLTVPVNLRSAPARSAEFTVSLVLPPGWTQSSATTRATVPAGSEASIALPAVAPTASDNSFEKIGVQVLSGGTTVLEDSIFATVVTP